MTGYCYSRFLEEETEAQGEITNPLSGSVPCILALGSVFFTIWKYDLSRVDLELPQNIFTVLHEFPSEQRMLVESIDLLIGH